MKLWLRSLSTLLFGASLSSCWITQTAEAQFQTKLLYCRWCCGKASDQSRR
jgi:hypothetical protein